jgi:hypothetical protein
VSATRYKDYRGTIIARPAAIIDDRECACSRLIAVSPMCEKCHELDGRIEQNERISSRIGDQLTVDRIKVLVAELRTQRSGLHPQTKAPNGTTEP